MSEATIIALITTYAGIFGVDPRLAVSVARVESKMNPAAISGDRHDYGLFQLRDSSFPKYSKKQLLDTKTNIILAMMYMRDLKKSCVHKKDNTWLICWNYGTGNAKKVKYPKLFPYFRKVASEMENNKLELAGQVGYYK